MKSYDLELWQVVSVQGQINFDLGALQEAISVVGYGALVSPPSDFGGVAALGYHPRVSATSGSVGSFKGVLTTPVRIRGINIPRGVVQPRLIVPVRGRITTSASRVHGLAAPCLVARSNTSLGGAISFAGAPQVDWNVDWDPKGGADVVYGPCALASNVHGLDWRFRGEVVSEASYSVVQYGPVTSAWFDAHYADAVDLLAALFVQYGELGVEIGAPTSDYSHGDRVTLSRDTSYEEATYLGSDFTGTFHGFMNLLSVVDSVLWESGQPLSITLELLGDRGSELWRNVADYYEEAVSPGYGRHYPPEPPKPPVNPVLVNIDLDGIHNDGTNLEFFLHSTASNVVPVKRSYVVSNSITLQLLSSGEYLAIQSLSMDIDKGSWAWGFSFKVHANDAHKLNAAPAPMAMLLVVNGHPFKAIGEKVTTNRKFGTTSLTITARGVSALLDNPYVRDKSFTVDSTKTAQQLMGSVLTENGVPIGWEVDWRILDWLVLSGAWSLKGSYIDAIKSIAQAAGAYVTPHPTDHKLIISPLYKWLPEEWADQTPDLEIPHSVVEVEAVKTTLNPEYNAVYVSGTVPGSVVALVRKTGSAGNLLASTVTDPLITAPEAARQRGTAILGAGGLIKTYTLSMPILAETGILELGALIRYIDPEGVARLGVVRGVSVTCSALPVIRQSVEVEVHG